MTQKDHVARIQAAIRKKFGDESVVRLGEEQAASEIKEVIPTGVEVVDRYLLGCGGLPVGRMGEIYSEEGVGKTSFAMSCAAGAQREGGVVVWCETEGAINSERFTLFGADVNDLLVCQPDCIERAGEEIEVALGALPKGSGPHLIVWDSVAATPTRKELEGGIEDYKAIPGERARALGMIVRLLKDKIIEKRAALLFINQIRHKVGVMFGDPETTPGGFPIKFAASYRIKLYSGKGVKDGDEHTGKAVTFSGVKNRMATPWRKVSVRLDFASGWDNDWSTLNHAKDRKLVEESARASAKSLAEARTALGWPEPKPHGGA